MNDKEKIEILRDVLYGLRVKVVLLEASSFNKATNEMLFSIDEALTLIINYNDNLS